VTLADTMRQEVAAWKRLAEMTGRDLGPSLMTVVLEHGQPYEIDREASSKVENGLLQECFGNATNAALWSDELTYVEGFAIHGFLPVHHAWVINAEGKALEVTWRDGGNECGFCWDGERELDQDEDGYDEDDESTWVATCRFCGGSGKGAKHRTLEDAEYYGIAVPDEVLRKTIMRRGIYGVLNTQDDINAILAARSA
jgi:hypothetical protein